MARRTNKSLASFSDVANNQDEKVEEQQQVTEKNSKSEKNNVETEIAKNENSVIKNIIKEKDKPAKKLIGIYFEEDVAHVLDKLGKDKKGIKSQIVNDLIKDVFIEEGFLQEK